MLQDFEATNWQDAEGRPAGGYVDAIGLHITWQNGALGRGDDRKEPNGAFVETVIAAAKQRIEFYETTDFKCQENQIAIGHLALAMEALHRRTTNREARGVEGTHVV